jgi:ATP-binding cassette subfamily A (ABC1) protein 3
MPTVGSQIKPILLKELWLSKRSLGKSILCYFVIPFFMIAISIGMSYIMFSVVDVTAHSSGAPKIDGISISQGLFRCSLDHKSDCNVGLAPNYTTYPGSASLLTQVRVFLEWSSEVSRDYNFVLNKPLSFSSDREMEEYYGQHDSLYAGVVLDASRYPDHVSYDIRISSSNLPAPILPSRPSLFLPSFSDLLGGAGAFSSSGFTSLQTISDSAIGTVLARDLNLGASPLAINSTMSAWPSSNMFSAMGIVMIPAYLGWAFLGASYLVSHDLVHDRVSKLKEYLKIMGMKETAYWLSYFLWTSMLSALPMLLLCIGASALGFFGPNVALGILYVFLFGLSAISWTMFAGAVAPSTQAASAIVMIFFCFPFIAALLVNLPAPAKTAISIVSSANFQFSMTQLIKDKAIHEMGHTRTTPSAILALSDYSTISSICMFLVDIAVYTFLAWYFAQILGGSEEYGGTPKKWYFLFTRSYWFKGSSKHHKSQYVDDIESDDDGEMALESQSLLNGSKSKASSRVTSPVLRDPAHFEPFHGNPSDLRLRTRGLVKRYKGAEVNAVNGLDLDVFQGIYVLLGENGSGKSTTISMLTGLIPLTAGSASVDGADLATQLDFVRDSISICPQHDLLSDQMTGAEHLKLFGMLKGVPRDELEARIPVILGEVGLSGTDDKLVSAYSGGMKRSLSLAISLVANSRVVFIDEASSGMDMEKRRSLWDMLLAKKKEGITLVLTTHYMEEAEILGDRIGIMHRGNLVREGSLEFLKRELGYQIHVSGPQGVLSQQLPLSKRNELPALLSSLESSNNSVSVTTPNLEEVFIQLGKSLDTTDASSLKESAPFSKHQFSVSDSPAPVPRSAPRSQQISALLKKKTRLESRNLGGIMCFLLAPIIFTALGLSISRISASYMRELPAAMTASKASSDPLWISIEPPSLLQIPYASKIRSLDSMLTDWGSPLLEFGSIGSTVEDLSNFFWNGTTMPSARLGGYYIENMFPGRFGLDVRYGIEYNQTEVYSLPTLINLMNNAVVRQYLNDSSAANISSPRISVRSVPFQPKTETDDAFVLKILTNNLITIDTQFALLICIVFAVLAGLIGKDATGDYEKQIVYQLQRIGLPRIVYWSSSLIFNFGRMTVSCILMMIVVASFRLSMLQGSAFGIFTLSLLLQAYTAVVFAILLSKLFSKQSSSQKFLPLILILLIIIPNMMTNMLRGLAAIKSLTKIFIPLSEFINYASPMTLLVGALFALSGAYTSSFSSPSFGTLISMKYAGTPLLIQFAYLAVLLIALVVIERLQTKIRLSPGDETLFQQQHRAQNPLAASGQMEQEVALSEGEASDENAVMLEDISKRYPLATRRAVVGMSLAVPNGICFGLLGPNGAGKSTTISMIIGDVTPTAGQYYLRGEAAIGANRDELYDHVRLACCLQTDSLFPELSVKEHIELYLAIRNHLSDFDMRELTISIMDRMRLSLHANKLAKELSGGNKRKLCTAISALIFTDIVVLDEPSTGCDPSMRRTLWEVIHQEQANKGLILTTHSMDEADAVCNRIAIMVNGEVVSLGTPQALKAQCGGYELKVWIAGLNGLEEEDSTSAKLEDEVLKPVFPALNRIERDTDHSGAVCIKYDLGLVKSIADTFGVLQRALEEGLISDYSVSQTTLGTAYQRLVRQQVEDPPSEVAK